MKKRTALAALAAVAAAALVLPTSSAGAQDTVPIYVVHGINIAGETPVNVCVGPDEVLGDFEFTDIAGPLDLPVGAELPIRVIAAEDACDADGVTPIIDQAVTVPAGPAALVATGVAEGEGFQLTPFELDLECTAAGEGRLSAFHASANTGPVTLTVGGAPVGELSFGGDFSADVPEGEYPVAVLVGETPVIEADIPASEGVNTLAFVVGNFPDDPNTPVAAVVEGIEVGTCGEPTPPDDDDVVPEDPTGPGAVPGTPVDPGAAGERPLALTG